MKSLCPKPAAMIGSMSSVACSAWRIFLFVMRPALWFSTATAQPRGLTMRDSMCGNALIRSHASCFTNMP